MQESQGFKDGLAGRDPKSDDPIYLDEWATGFLQKKGCHSNIPDRLPRGRRRIVIVLGGLTHQPKKEPKMVPRIPYGQPDLSDLARSTHYESRL